MTNTTENMNKTFADAMKQELGIYIKSARKRYEDAQAKLIADIQTNPISAITWSAEDMVKRQTDYEVWLRIEREMAEHDTREVLAENLKEVNYRIRSFFGSNSTSMLSNSVERARAEALVRLSQELESLCKHFGI